MADRDWIEPIVERVVGQVLESHKTQLQGELVRRVMEELAAQPALAASPAASSATDLARSVSEIQLGTSQKEILRALLDSSSRYAARVALFVVKGNHATGWQARGFANCDAVKDFTLDSNAPAVIRALIDRVSANAPTSESDARFLEVFGSPASGETRLLPLILKDKVAALIYADGGSDGPLDAGSLEVLVMATSAWLEVNALRKQVHKEAVATPAETSAPVPEQAPALTDPFSGHSPAFAMAAAASAASGSAAATPAVEPVPADVPAHQEGIAEGQSTVVEVQSAAAPANAAEPLLVGQAQVEVASPAPPFDAVSPADQEIHRKAQRFARLLVDEIKLYNLAKVSEGREHKDLYDRLKDTIDKSRSTYQKRYGNTVAASGNYFQHEVIRSLAEDDPSAMGSNFHL
jgi:hypothetical protein